MKINDLLDRIKDNGLSMPETGTGVNGRILSRDLESVLGDYFAKLKYRDPSELAHLEMRRAYVPPKAYRFKELSSATKKEVFEDGNKWVLEQKYNGWRMIITYIPSDGFMFWGGNISDVDFLPVDYTDRVTLSYCHPRDEKFHNLTTSSRVLDSEAICHTDVEMLDGAFSNNTLDAVKAILGSDKDRAIKLQFTHLLDFYLFDCVDPRDNYKFGSRVMDLDFMLISLHIDQFHRTPQFNLDKKTKLQELWRMGHEGCILKNINAPCVPGSRSKDIAIKVKRSMSGEIGDDLDAFVSGWIMTKEWDKKGLIGGVKLSVWSNGEKHPIATVTNMPDNIRLMLTLRHYDGQMNLTGYNLHPKYLKKVLVVDGQELSARNQMILHATVDWDRGFRKTKSASECVFNLKAVESERF